MVTSGRSYKDNCLFTKTAFFFLVQWLKELKGFILVGEVKIRIRFRSSQR